MNVLIVGVDPGLDGATVMISAYPNRKLIWSIMHKSIERDDHYLNGKSYIDTLDKKFTEYPFSRNMVLCVAIEAAAVLGGQAGQRTVGVNWGVIKCAWDIVQYPIVVIPANVWKPVIVGKALSKKHGKESSIIVCSQYGFEIPTRTDRGSKQHDGVADAALVAEYAWRKYGQ